MSSGTPSAAIAAQAPSAPSKPKPDLKLASWYLALFAAVFLTGLCNYFGFEHRPTTFQFDGWLYRWTSNRVNEFLTAVLNGQFNPNLISDAAFQDRIIPDGPLLPGIFGLLSAVCKHSPYAQDWQFVVAIQCFMHAISACLVASLAWRLLRSRGWSFLAGALWGFFPVALIQTGVFYTEPTIVLFLLAYTFCLTKDKASTGSLLAAGFFGGCLFIQKVALVPALFLSACWQVKSAKHWQRNILLLAVGALLVVGSWGLFTRVVTGNFCLTAQRYPAFNAAVGWDTESDGQAGTNTPLLELLLSSGGAPGTAMLSQWTVHRQECQLLLVKKISRLLCTPWNDFMDHCLGLSPQLVAVPHFLLLYLFAFGALTYAVDRRRIAVSESKRAGDIYLIVVFGHLVYLAFMTNSRYAFTAIPFWAIFSAYFLMQLKQRLSLHGPERNAQLLRAAACTLAGSVLITLSIQAENLTKIGSNHELSHTLSAGATAVKELVFEPGRLPAQIHTTLLMVDGDKRLANATVEINGHKVQSQLSSLNNFDPVVYQTGMDNAIFAHSAGLTGNDLRQWRGVAFPAEWLNSGGKNLVKIKQEVTPATIYGDSDPNCRTMLDTTFNVAGARTPDCREIESRAQRQITCGRVAQHSWIAEGEAAGAEHCLADSLRIKIAVEPGAPTIAPPVTKELESLKRTEEIAVERFDKLLWANCGGTLCINKLALKAARSTRVTIRIPDLPSASHIGICVRGEVMAVKDRSQPSMAINFTRNPNCAPGLLAATPNYIEAGKNWREFEIRDVVPVKSLGSKDLELSIWPGPWLDVINYGCPKNPAVAAFRNLKVEYNVVNLPTLSLNKLLYY
jgi:hypothetical protein